MVNCRYLSAIPEQAYRRIRSITFLMPFLRPSDTASGWDCQSAAQSLNPMVVVCGRRTALAKAQRFGSLYPLWSQRAHNISRARLAILVSAEDWMRRRIPRHRFMHEMIRDDKCNCPDSLFAGHEIASLTCG